MNLNKTAILINSLEPILFSKTNKASCFVVVEKNTLLADFVKRNFPPEKIIFISTRDSKHRNLSLFEEIIKNSDIPQHFRKNEISYLVVSHRSSEKIEQWAAENNISLIVTPFKMQYKLENKRYFDNLLKKNNIKSPKTIFNFNEENLNDNVAYVFQDSDSFGMFGTKFFGNGSHLLSFIKREKPDMNNFLVREYLDGTPIGVSIFLDKNNNYFFSGFRRQCFSYEKSFPKQFLGIQWLPTNFFSKAMVKKISFELSKLVNLLVFEGFFGVANIDLLLYNGEPYILECNPRLSSATPQIFSTPNLSSISNPWKFFLNTFHGNKNKMIRNKNIPKHNFSGSLLDVDIKEEIKIKNVIPVGIYSFYNEKIIFKGNSVKEFKKNKNYFLLFHELSPAQKKIKDATLCTLISNSPLFNGESGSLNDQGVKIFDYILKEFSEK